MSKFRNWRLVTYLSEEQLLQVIDEHTNQIKAYAYILHDKDVNDDGNPKPPHIHLLLALHNVNSITGILKWFYGFEDDKGNDINTLAKVMSNPHGAYGYLTHNTVASAHKYQYDESLIKSVNGDFFVNYEIVNDDKLSSALQEMLDGIPISEVAKKYGRDFIIHYAHIRALYNDIQSQIGGKKL